MLGRYLLANLWCVGLVMALFPVSAHAQVWGQEARIELLPEMERGFGVSVALDGDTLLIGATSADGAWVFVREGGQWTQQAKLGPMFAAAHGFGYAIALSGDTALVGAPHEDRDGIVGIGAAYVFVREGGMWTKQGKLVADDGGETNWFGYSVGLHGDVALVGSFRNDPEEITNAGAAYVFVRNGSTWSFQTKLTADDPEDWDQFGKAVALGETMAVVGAPDKTHSEHINAGAVYAIARNGATFGDQTKLVADDPGDYDRFGSMVATSGNLVVVGARGNDSIGAAYVFSPPTAGSQQLTKLTASDAQPTDDFGIAVAVHGDTVLVRKRGPAYLFQDNGGNWPQVAILDVELPSDPYGVSVAVHDNVAVVGSLESVYVFRYAKEDGDPCTADEECLSGSCVEQVCGPKGQAEVTDDAGTTSPDGGETSPDAGPSEPSTEGDGGCSVRGHRSPLGPMAWVLIILTVALLRPRRPALGKH